MDAREAGLPTATSLYHGLEYFETGVVTDGEHRLHGHFVSAKAKRFGDAFVDGDIMPGGKRAPQFTVRKLVGIQTHHVHAGRNHFAVEEVRRDKILENDMRVTAVSKR